MTPQIPNIDKARAAWPTVPDWVAVLAEECDRSSQGRVGHAIGYSGAAVSQVIGNKYTGAIANVEVAVRGAFMGQAVTCPVLGELSLNKCLTHQRAKLITTNPQRIRLYKACRRCSNRRTP